MKVKLEMLGVQWVQWVWSGSVLELPCVQERYKGTCASVVGSRWMVLLWFNAYVLQDSFCLVFSASRNVLPHHHCPCCLVLCFGNQYLHTCTRKERGRKELKPSSLSLPFFCCLLSFVLCETCSAASPFWRFPLGAVPSPPPPATSSRVHPVWGYCCVTSNDMR